MSSTCLLILPLIYDDRDNIFEENATLLVSQFSLPYSFSHLAIFVFRYRVHILRELVFHEVACTLKQGYQITHILPCMYSIIVFQNPIKHITIGGLFPLEMEIYLFILKFTVHMQYIHRIRVASC